MNTGSTWTVDDSLPETAIAGEFDMTTLRVLRDLSRDGERYVLEVSCGERYIRRLVEESEDT